MKGRRALLGLGALGFGYWGLTNVVPGLWTQFGPLPEFTTDGVPPGFVALSSEADTTSAIGNPLIGLENSPQPARELDDEALCRALLDGAEPGRVRLNYFTDYNCPYCRVLGRDLQALVSARPQETELVYNELPLLGPESVTGARAALAAQRQGAYLKMHELLNTGFVRIDDEFVLKLANELALDVETFKADMVRLDADFQLQRSSAIADRFAVIGTPFLLVGRIAVYGRIDPALLDRLVDASLGMPEQSC